MLILKSHSIFAGYHLNPGYLILGYKQEGGGGGVASPKNLMKRRSHILQELPVKWSNPARQSPPHPIKNEQNFIGLQDHRSSELALDHENFKAIKKKLKQINMQHLSFQAGLSKAGLR